MKGEELTEFRKRSFPGKLSQEEMSTVFGVKYNTLRRYEGNNPLPIPEVLSKSIGFYQELQELKNKGE